MFTSTDLLILVSVSSGMRPLLPVLLFSPLLPTLLDKSEKEWASFALGGKSRDSSLDENKKMKQSKAL